MINKNIRPPKIKGFELKVSNGKITKKPSKPKINLKQINKNNKSIDKDLFNFNFINKI